MFRPAGDFDRPDPRPPQLAFERLRHLRDQPLALIPLLRHELGERAILVGLEVLERQVLELPAHLRHTEAVRQRGVEIPRLLRDPSLLLGTQEFERPHVVQPIGQLDDDHAGVLRDREQQLPVVLDLPLLQRMHRQRPDLRQPIDDRRDLPAEFLFDLLDRDRGVLDHIVDQAARDGDRIELQVGENLRDLDAVEDVVLPGKALLPQVRPLAEPKRARQQLGVQPLGGLRVAQLPMRDHVSQSDRRGGTRRCDRGGGRADWRRVRHAHWRSSTLACCARPMMM